MTTPQVATEASPSPAVLPADSDTVARLATYYKLLGDFAADQKAKLRRYALDNKIIRAGATLPVGSAFDDDVQLSTVSITKPKRKVDAEITDREAFNDWARENYPDRCVERDVVVGSQAQLIEAIREYAPADIVDQLLTTDIVPDGGLVADVLRLSKQAEGPAGPAGEVDDTHRPAGITVTATTPEPNISVRAVEGAVEELTMLMSAGRLPGPLPLEAPTEND